MASQPVRTRSLEREDCSNGVGAIRTRSLPERGQKASFGVLFAPCLDIMFKLCILGLLLVSRLDGHLSRLDAQPCFGLNQI